MSRKGRNKINSSVLCVAGGVINAHSKYANYVYILNKSGISGIGKSSLPLSTALKSLESPKPVTEDAVSSAVPSPTTSLPATLLPDTPPKYLKFITEGQEILRTTMGVISCLDAFKVALHLYNANYTNRKAMIDAMKINVPRIYSEDTARAQLAYYIDNATCPEQILIFSFISYMYRERSAGVTKPQSQHLDAFYALSDLIKKNYTDFNKAKFSEFVETYTASNLGKIHFPTSKDLETFGILCR